MRVLMLSSNWPPAGGGGAEAYVARLTSELRGAGHEVGAVTLGIGGADVVASVPPAPHRLDHHRAAAARDKLRFHLNDLWRRDVIQVVTRAIERFRPDIVHSHVVAGMSVRALTAPSRTGTPHVHTLHDHWLRCWRSTGTSRSQGPCGPACAIVARARGAALRRRGPDIFVAISEAVGDAHGDVRTGRVRVIRHPADVRPRGDGRGRSGRRGPLVFGFLGQLNPNKGVEVLLEAASRGLRHGEKLLVAGSGRLSDRVATADIPAVEPWGWVSGARREAFFDAVDCLVVPSVWDEPAGLVVREAAARGVPVIASEVGGIPEYVPTSCRGLLFPAGDVDGLTARLSAFREHPEGFAVDPAEIPTWDDHLAEVTAAYDAARRPAPIGAPS